MKVSKILVPLDGSPLAETALGPALDLASGWGASVLLLRAAEAHGLPGTDPTEAQVEVVREAEEYLDSVTRRFRGAPTAGISTSVWYGAPAEAIAEAARFNRVDMIVMTTHGRSGLGRMFLGSVAESVLRSTPTPVLVLHPDGAPLQAFRAQSRPATTSRSGPGDDTP
jgi:nucleotide-binding universal stress UspA family protein